MYMYYIVPECQELHVQCTCTFFLHPSCQVFQTGTARHLESAVGLVPVLTHFASKATHQLWPE